MASSPVALILGAGPRVGASVAAAFVKDGYKVAVVSRKGTNDQTSEGYFSLKADFESPDTIPQIFSVVKKELQAAPSVVVYNAGGFTAPPDDKSVLSVPHQSLAKDLNLNIISPYVAAQEALKGWETLPGGAKSFIYTGNKANTAIMPFAMTMTLGVGKAGSAYWVGIADKLYSERGYRFFYADQRKADGGPAGFDLDGPAHGDFYSQLAKHGEIPWHATFVKDQGYVKF